MTDDRESPRLILSNLSLIIGLTMSDHPERLASVLAVIDGLERVLLEAPSRLQALSGEELTLPPRPGKWSKQEILGHLIDSASNNHHRFVTVLIDRGGRFPFYDPDAWVRVQGYRHAAWLEMIALWVTFNGHLVHVLRAMSAEDLALTCIMGDEEVTLEFLVTDYLAHMKHHLRQIFGAEWEC